MEPAAVLDPGRNLGYAGGVNLGVRETSADHVVVMNPDVWVQEGCIGSLIAALGAAEVVGPRFSWDPDVYRRIDICVDNPNDRIRYFYDGAFIYSTGADEGGMAGALGCGIFSGKTILSYGLYGG